MGARLPAPPGSGDFHGEECPPRSQRHPRARGERLFQIPLKAMVEGPEADGLKFLERTEVSSINAQIASFPLKAKVLIGARLKLNLAVPSSLLLGGPLSLALRGRVVRVQAQSGFKPQAVTIYLEKQFTFLK
jgi:hypothetical protein